MFLNKHHRCWKSPFQFHFFVKVRQFALDSTKLDNVNYSVVIRKSMQTVLGFYYLKYQFKLMTWVQFCYYFWKDVVIIQDEGYKLYWDEIYQQSMDTYWKNLNINLHYVLWISFLDKISFSLDSYDPPLHPHSSEPI